MSRIAVTFAIVSMFAWGIWSVVVKEATREITPETAMIISYVASVAVALGYLFVIRGGPTSLSSRGIGLALLAGVFGAVGAIAFYVGLSAGRTAIVTTISALYFVVAAVIGVLILGESVAISDVVGVGFAVAAVALLAQ